MSRRAPDLRRLAPWAFPLACLLAVVVLGALNLNGSSLAMYGRVAGESDSAAGVVGGSPKPIRSDEWLVRTPWVIGQVNRDLPETARGGVGEHDLGLLYDLPTGSLDLLVRPHLAPYAVLPPDRALAVEWWTLLALQAVGVYALVQTVTRRPELGAAAGTLMALAPVTQWWTVPMTFTVVGYSTLAAAALIHASRAERRRSRVAWAVAGGWSAACFLATLYPPWQIGVALVVAGVVAGVVWQDVMGADDRAAALKPLGVLLAVAGATAGALFASYVLRHLDALDAVASTVYPGQRAGEQGGGASLVSVLSGPLDLFSSGSATGQVNGTNQSENASGLLLLVPVAVVVLMLAQGGPLRRRREIGPLLGTLVAGGVVTAWMFLPLPSWVGAPLLLNRVTGGRLVLPLVLAGIIAFVLLIHHLSTTGERLSVGRRIVATATVLALHGWAAGQMAVDGGPVSHRRAAIYLLVVGLGCFLALGRWWVIGLSVLVLFSAVQTVRINPIQHGTDPLTDNPLRRAIDEVAREIEGDEGWAVFGEQPYANGILTASGVANVTAVSFYPDSDAWRVLDPDGESEHVWNRYARVEFHVGEPGAPPEIRLESADAVSVTIDVCDPRLDELGVEVMIVPVDLEPECGTLIEETRLGGSHYRIYEVEVATP